MYLKNNRPHPVTRWLQALISRYSPDDEQLDLAIKRAGDLGRLFDNSDFGVLEWDLGGSCRKRTAIRPVDDVDLFVYVDERHWENALGRRCPPDEFLDAFYQRLTFAKKYHIKRRTLKIRSQKRSVRLIYHREGSVQIDVVPCLWNGNSQRLVEIPDVVAGCWVRTCVQRQANLLLKMDNEYLQLRRAIRLLKIWKAHYGLTSLRSYAVELLAMHALHEGAPLSDVSLFRSVLRRLANSRLDTPICIPDVIRDYKFPFHEPVIIMDVGVNQNNVASNINEKERERIVAAAERAVDFLDHAYDAYNAGHEQEAWYALQHAVGD